MKQMSLDDGLVHILKEWCLYGIDHEVSEGSEIRMAGALAVGNLARSGKLLLLFNFF